MQKTSPYACYCLQTNQACGDLVPDSLYDMYTVDEILPDGAVATTVAVTAAAVPTGTPKTKTATPTPFNACARPPVLQGTNKYCSNDPPGTSIYSADLTAQGCVTACCQSGFKAPF